MCICIDLNCSRYLHVSSSSVPPSPIALMPRVLVMVSRGACSIVTAVLLEWRASRRVYCSPPVVLGGAAPRCHVAALLVLAGAAAGAGLGARVVAAA